MINYFFKRIYRNKWLLIKMFVLSPFISILPIILIKQTLNNVSFSSIVSLCLWSYVYFSTFEKVNINMKDFKKEKRYDILISNTKIFSFHLYEEIAIIISFLPSLILSFTFYFLIYQIEINYLLLFIGIIGTIIFNFVIMDFTFLLELKFNNYFNKFNFAMSLFYIISCVLYSFNNLPIGFRIITYISPLSFLFNFIYDNNYLYLIIYFALTILLYLIIRILIMIIISGKGLKKDESNNI